MSFRPFHALEWQGSAPRGQVRTGQNALFVRLFCSCCDSSRIAALGILSFDDAVDAVSRWRRARREEPELTPNLRPLRAAFRKSDQMSKLNTGKTGSILSIYFLFPQLF